MWFRNDWSKWIAESNRAEHKPSLKQTASAAGTRAVAASHSTLGEFTLFCDAKCRCYSPRTKPITSGFFRDKIKRTKILSQGWNQRLRGIRNQDAVNPEKQGTKVAAHYKFNVGAGQTEIIRLRLSKSSAEQKGQPFGKEFDQIFADRLREAMRFTNRSLRHR